MVYQMTVLFRTSPDLADKGAGTQNVGTIKCNASGSQNLLNRKI